MNARRIVIGAVHRIVYATFFALLTWHSCTWPFGDSDTHRRVVKSVCYTLNFPTALIGRLTAPYRGIDPLFDRGGEWCDFCSPQQVLWYHIRFAVPVFVTLFYLPAFVRWILQRRRSRVNSKRIKPAVDPTQDTATGQ